MEEFKNLKLPKALADELHRAEQSKSISWASTNEGIHEKVNFDDTIWGLSLAGGVYYNTPLRVTQVKEGSRAEHAGIRIGDYLRSINDIDTTTLTIQEAHDIILKSGLEIKFALSAPDVEETIHNVYQDEFEDEEVEEKSKHERKLEYKQLTFKGAKTFYTILQLAVAIYAQNLRDMDARRKIRLDVLATKTVLELRLFLNDSWSLAWPCSKKRDIMYRESNCFLVPSRYQTKHPDQFLNGSNGKGKESKTDTATIEEVLI